MEIKERWEMLHKESRFRPKYPSETVVQFLLRNFKRDRKTEVLDLGCGAGRHVIFMANENIKGYGVDISIEGVKYTKKMLIDIDQQDLSENIYLSSVDNLPFKDNKFDGLICYGVLYYCKKNEIEKAINEIYRVLKIGGRALLIVRSTADYRFGLGKEIEKNTFIIEEEDSSKCANNESGMSMHFFEREELEKLFRGFSKVDIDLIEETHSNMEYKDSNFKITIIK